MSYNLPAGCDTSLWNSQYRNEICGATSENLANFEEFIVDLVARHSILLSLGSQDEFDFALIPQIGLFSFIWDNDYEDWLFSKKEVERKYCYSLYRVETEPAASNATTAFPAPSLLSTNILAIGPPPKSEDSAIISEIFKHFFVLGYLLVKRKHQNSEDWSDTYFQVMRVTAPPSKVGFWLLAEPNGFEWRELEKDDPYEFDEWPEVRKWCQFERSQRIGKLPGNDQKFAYARIKDDGPEGVFDLEFAEQRLFVIAPGDVPFE